MRGDSASTISGSASTIRRASRTSSCPRSFWEKCSGLTERIRIGPAPVCLQYHHPAHVAGRLAFLDHMSRGRLNVCFGPGAIPTDMEVFGAHPSEIGARVAESIDMIMRLWAGEVPIDIEGRFWNVKMKDNLNPKFGVGHLHKPFQRPHPPIYVPSISRASVGLSKAAERGFRFISHHMIHTSALREQWQTYSQAATAAGRTAEPSDWAVARNVFVADSTDEARRLAKGNSLGSCIQYILDLTRATAPTGVAMWKRDRTAGRFGLHAGLLHERRDHRRRSGTRHPPTAGVTRRDRPVRHAGADRSRLGRP